MNENKNSCQREQQQQLEQKTTAVSGSRERNRMGLSRSEKSATMMLVAGLGLVLFVVAATLQPTTAVVIEESASSAGVGASAPTVVSGSGLDDDGGAGGEGGVNGDGSDAEKSYVSDGVINYGIQNNKKEEPAWGPGRAEAVLSIGKRSLPTTNAPPAYDSDFLGELIVLHAEINDPKPSFDKRAANDGLCRTGSQCYAHKKTDDAIIFLRLITSRTN